MPGDVLGSAGYAPEPRWHKLPQMPFAEFYQGLRERNWTHAAYDPSAPAWNIQFFQDSGRFLRPSFDGFRYESTVCWLRDPDPRAVSSHLHTTDLLLPRTQSARCSSAERWSQRQMAARHGSTCRSRGRTTTCGTTQRAAAAAPSTAISACPTTSCHRPTATTRQDAMRYHDSGL